MNTALEFLKNTITENMPINDIVDVFQQVCQPMDEEDMILFETGTYNFTGEELFYFSLVKQIPNDEDEFYQLHVDVLYKPNAENKLFNDTVWDEDLDDDIFEYIKSSNAFNYANDNKYLKVEIFLDET